MTGCSPLPPGACDTHIHFYDRRHAAAPDSILRPPDASVDDYRRVQQRIGLTRTVVVQPTTYGLDNRCQLEAMASLGPAARGVMVVDSTTPTAELDRLDSLGVRGARFHMLPGGAVPWTDLDAVATTIDQFGWHIQLQLNGRELADRLEQLLGLPTPLVVDHIGRFMPPVDVDHTSFIALRRLVDQGKCWVKLSAPYESSTSGPPSYADVDPLARALVEQAPERMLWATNWPHPGQADPPDGPTLVNLLTRWVGDEQARRRILVDNPAELYRF